MLWVAGLMLNCQDDDGFSLNKVEDSVGEPSHDSPTDTAVLSLVQSRVLNDPLKLLLERSHELLTKTGKLSLVVVEGFRDIAFGLTSELSVPSHARLRIRAFTSGQGEAASGSRRYASRRRSIFSRSASDRGKGSGSSETLSQIA